MGKHLKRTLFKPRPNSGEYFVQVWQVFDDWPFFSIVRGQALKKWLEADHISTLPKFLGRNDPNRKIQESQIYRSHLCSFKTFLVIRCKTEKLRKTFEHETICGQPPPCFAVPGRLRNFFREWFANANATRLKRRPLLISSNLINCPASN